MTETDKLIKFVNEGIIPPLPKGQSMENLSPPTLPDEVIAWIGTVNTDPIMFIGVTKKYGLTDVTVGISPYRIMFCGKPAFSNKVYSRTYWFQVDFEGTLWQRGTIGKEQYTSLSLSPPKHKKGVLSREIVLTNTATRTDGRQDKTFETTLSNLKWRNPQTGKFEGGKSDNLFQQIMEFYNQRRPITLRALLLLASDPEALEEEMLATQPAEGQAIQVTAPATVPQSEQPLPQATPQPVSVPPPATPLPRPQPAQRRPQQPASDQPEIACPVCGKALRPGVKFCGGCGAKFDEETSASVVKPKPKTFPSPKNTEPVSMPAETVCPSCGQTLQPGINFCGSCGARLDESTVKPVKKRSEKAPTTCPACDKPIEKGWKACPFCGQSLLKSPENTSRKQKGK